MKLKQRSKVEIRNAIRVGRTEGAVDVIASRGNAPASRCVETGVEAVDLNALRPGFGGNEYLDLLAQVTGQWVEAAESLPRVDLDDVPDHELSAHLDEWLGQGLGLLAKPGAASAAEDQNGWKVRHREWSPGRPG